MAVQVQITVDCADPQRLSRFWANALGYRIPLPPGDARVASEDPFAAWHAFLEQAGVPKSEWNRAAAAEDPDGSGPRLFFQRVPEPKSVKNRLHLDLRAADGSTGAVRMDRLEAEAERLVALGASRLERHEPAPPLSAGFIVMADPEGNEFCLD